MSSEPTVRTPYGDAETPAQMRPDCLAVGEALRAQRVARAAARPAPSLAYDDFPREVPKREVRISDAAARLAAALHLHLD